MWYCLWDLTYSLTMSICEGAQYGNLAPYDLTIPNNLLLKSCCQADKDKYSTSLAP